MRIFFSLLYFGNAIATIGTKIFPLFQQWHCHKPTEIFFSSPISTMSLPQIHSTFFLRNDMCTQFLQQILSVRLLLLD